MVTGAYGRVKLFENMDVLTKRVFANGASVMPQAEFLTGNNYYVYSGVAASGDGSSPSLAFSTIAAAVAVCTANNNDKIIVLPGHTETVASAAAINLSTAGISLIGLGYGSNRPTLSFATSTAASFRVSAANCWIENFLFIGVVDALVSPIQIQAADCALVNCEYRDTAATQCTDCILTTAAANRLLIKNFRYDGDTAAGTNAAIAIVGGDRITIDGLWMDGNFAVAGIDIRTTATTDLEVRNAQFRNRTGAGASSEIFLKDTITGSTGMIGPNIQIRLPSNTTNITEACTGATFVYFQPINVVNLAGEVAMQINITASTDA